MKSVFPVKYYYLTYVCKWFINVYGYEWCRPFCSENKLDQIIRWIVFRCVLCVKSWTVQVGDRWHRTCFDIQRANKHIVKHCKHWVVFFKSNSFHWTVKDTCFNVLDMLSSLSQKSLSNMKLGIIRHFLSKFPSKVWMHTSVGSVTLAISKLF